MCWQVVSKRAPANGKLGGAATIARGSRRGLGPVKLAQPGQFENQKALQDYAEAHTKAILRAEFEAAAPIREAMRIKRERLKAKRATRQRQ